MPTDTMASFAPTEQDRARESSRIALRIETLQAEREVLLARGGDANHLWDEIQVLTRHKDDHDAALRGIRRLQQEANKAGRAK